MKPAKSITRLPDSSLLWVPMPLGLKDPVHCNIAMTQYIDPGLLVPMQVGRRDVYQVSRASSHFILRDEPHKPLGWGKMTVQTEPDCMGIES